MQVSRGRAKPECYVLGGIGPWYEDRDKGAKGPLWVPRWGHWSSRDGGDSTKSPSLGPSIAELGMGLEQRVLGGRMTLSPLIYT